MPKITFADQGISGEIEKGLSVLEAAERLGVRLYHTCGGNCSCSTCRVWVLEGGENLSAMESDEREVLDSFDLKAPHRLGCQARVMGPKVTVSIPKRSKEPRPNKTPTLPKESR